MKILVIGDVESRALWDYFDPARVEGVDLIISCGDLDPDYLEFLVTLSRCPLMYVHGNHDEKYAQSPPEGCDCIEDRIVTYKGFRILGLGGSLRYRSGTFMYSENQMRMRVFKAGLKSIPCGGVDILVTHSPARGWGDLDDYPHRGFECFNSFLEKKKPRLMLHGHVHKNYGHFVRERVHDCGTRMINAWEYCYVEI